MTKRKRAQRAPAQENVEETAPPVAAAFGDVSFEATDEGVPTSGTSTPRIDDAAPVAEEAPSPKRKRTRRGGAKDEPASEDVATSANAETDDATAASEIEASEVVEVEEASPPKKKAPKTRAAKKPRGTKAAPSADASSNEAPGGDGDDEPVPSGAVAATVLSDAMAGSDDDAPPIEGESTADEASSDESIEESTELTFEIGADILGPDPMGDVEATINLSGDVVPLPGRDDLDEPTVAVDGDALEEVDQEIAQQRHLRGLLEALIFASDSPIKVNDLAKLASASQKQVKDMLVELSKDYSVRGIHLDEVAAGWTFRTSAQYAPFIRDLTKQKPVRLTRAQVETLAIIAYRQPITRPEIDDVRGVDSGPVLKLLLERDLVRILGKRDEVGRPLIYGTTNEFLEFFGLRSLKDLPTLREFTELTDESRETYEEEMGEPLHEAPAPLADDEGPSEASSNDGTSAPPPDVGDRDEEGATSGSEPPSGVEESDASSSDDEDDDDLDEDDDDDDLDDEDEDDDEDDDDLDEDDDDEDDDLDEDDDDAQPVDSEEPDDASPRDSEGPDSEKPESEDSDSEVVEAEETEDTSDDES